MSNRFYKTRKNRLVAGVVAGLADKFGWDMALAYSHDIDSVWHRFVCGFSFSSPL